MMPTRPHLRNLTQSNKLNVIDRIVGTKKMTLQGNTLASPECGTVYEPSNPVSEQINGGVGLGEEERGGEGSAVSARGKEILHLIQLQT